MRVPLDSHKAGQSGVIGRKAVLWIAVPLAIGFSVIVWWWVGLLKYQRARTSWKITTLPRLASLSITNEEIRQELNTLKAGPTPSMHFGWAHDHVLLMTNGEYLIYASRHGFNNGLVNHLFLAHGSDGRWFYSTYHFCSEMVAIRSDKPPGSIAEFAKTYSAREFDGKSDECLKRTWPSTNSN